ncbi:hypothetical protein [Natrinema sp. SYSU A 869]|uniref:hypothetical protein n=1 Tax=Natrinema sp. SYSU A 869 TaxID=2871694 RepID=UPI001CA39D41|nr:hypothetical protein [Natrinema sp. SYSU A 869]
MLEQVDHRGKRFTIDNAIVDEIGDEHSQRAGELEQQAQREAREHSPDCPPTSYGNGQREF